MILLYKSFLYTYDFNIHMTSQKMKFIRIVYVLVYVLDRHITLQKIKFIYEFILKIINFLQKDIPIFFSPNFDYKLKFGFFIENFGARVGPFFVWGRSQIKQIYKVFFIPCVSQPPKEF